MLRLIVMTTVLTLAPFKETKPTLKTRYLGINGVSNFAGYTLANPLKRSIDATIDCGDWFEPLHFIVKAKTTEDIEIRDAQGIVQRFCMLADYTVTNGLRK